MSIEESPSVSMARAGKLIRKSVHTFLQHYQFFTTVAAFIALPFSISLLVSQALVPRSITLLPTIYGRLDSLFAAAGFPHSSEFFGLVTLKLSQTISSCVLTLPFSISFLLLAKASIINYFKNPVSSFFSLYQPLLTTHLCNSFVIFAANATCFSLFFLAFNFLEGFRLNSSNWVLLLTVVGAVFYSIVLANAIVVCNLALVSSGIETRKSPGFMAILRACVTIRGKTSTALAIAVPINLGLAAIECLFHYRIIRSHDHHVEESNTQVWLVALEGVLIAYLYSMLLVLDVIMSCMFYQCCKNDSLGHEIGQELEIEELFYYEDVNVRKLKELEEFV